MPFLGNQPSTGYSTIVKDDFTANGNDTVFTLSRTAASANSIAVFVGNVRQEPTDAYTVNGTTLTMSAAPANGANFYVLHISGAVENSSVPASGTIGTSQLANNAVTTAKIADDQVTSAKLDTNIAIDGDLTVDTNTLHVDSTNNRVGIGTASPTWHLHVNEPSSDSAYLKISNSTTGSSQITDGFDIGITASEEAVLYNRENTAMRFGTNNTERMRIDSSGRVTMPYQPVVYLYNTTNGTMSGTTTPTKIASGYTPTINVGNHWSTTNYRFTCPVAGIYMVTISYMRNTSSVYTHLDLYKNGSSLSGSGFRARAPNGVQYETVSIQGYVQCAVNDYLEFWYHENGGSTGIFSGHGGIIIKLVS